MKAGIRKQHRDKTTTSKFEDTRKKGGPLRPPPPNPPMQPKAMKGSGQVTSLETLEKLRESSFNMTSGGGMKILRGGGGGAENFKTPEMGR